MAQTLLQTEGVVIRGVPFREHDQILTIFTLDYGLLKIFCRNARSFSSHVPLTKVELLYRDGRDDMGYCHEMRLVDSYEYLKSHSANYAIACALLQTIAVSQYIGSAAPRLYVLLQFYLATIPYAIDPWTIVSSFRLKLLKHDGIELFPFVCNACSQSLITVAYREGGLWLCKAHRSLESIYCSAAELAALYHLANCLNIQEIAECSLTVDLHDKITAIFFYNIQYIGT